MPIYQYRCGKCNEIFDAQRPMSQAAESVTHSCGEPASRCYVSTPKVSFRPDGWYLSPEDPKYFSTLKDREKPNTWQVH